MLFRSEVVRGMFNSTVQDWTAAGTSEVYLAEYTERGAVNPLRASKPVFRLPTSAEGGAVIGGTASGTQAILRFAIDAVGETGVEFNDADGTPNYVTGDDLIQVRLTGAVDSSMTDHISTCELRNVTQGNNETLDTIDVSTISVDATGVDLGFDFSTNNLQISKDGTAVLEVRCTMALAAGETLSAQIGETPDGGGTQLAEGSVPTSTVIYDDGVDTAVDESATLIDNLPILGPAFDVNN